MLTSRHGIAFLASTVIINCRKKIRDRQHVSYSRTKNSLPLSLFLITPTQTLELKWTSHNRINGKSIYIWRWLVFYGTINRTLIQCKLIAILWRHEHDYSRILRHHIQHCIRQKPRRIIGLLYYCAFPMCHFLFNVLLVLILILPDFFAQNLPA
jgi:hypothetical protein